MGNTGTYGTAAVDLQKLLGNEYTKSLVGAEEGYRQSALDSLGNIESEWNPSNPKDILRLVGK